MRSYLCYKYTGKCCVHYVSCSIKWYEHKNDVFSAWNRVHNYCLMVKLEWPSKVPSISQHKVNKISCPLSACVDIDVPLSIDKSSTKQHNNGLFRFVTFLVIQTSFNETWQRNIPLVLRKFLLSYANQPSCIVFGIFPICGQNRDCLHFRTDANMCFRHILSTNLWYELQNKLCVHDHHELNVLFDLLERGSSIIVLKKTKIIDGISNKATNGPTSYSSYMSLRWLLSLKLLRNTHIFEERVFCLFPI